jgi:wyosine [tRNA(Phe)-imidazoG37] synthetase (radical SAM superfamily)
MEAISGSSIYGPVRSWRLGLSLGVDLLCVNSICSFQCIYCQLGKINIHTNERKIYVPTLKVIEDLKRSSWKDVDVITISGSGEPTLAANIGEVIEAIKSLTGKPLIVITNATTLNSIEVRKALYNADRVFCKLDSVVENSFKRINRPVEGINLETVINGIKSFREEYRGFLAIQVMMLHINRAEVLPLAEVLKEIAPDEVQLNTPLRPIPHEWFVDARGSYDVGSMRVTQPKIVTKEDASYIEQRLLELTNLKVTSVFSR